MKTTLDLLNEVISLGFDQKKTLGLIDRRLDDKLGIQNRKPLSDEALTDTVYNSILIFFQNEKDRNECVKN